MFSFWRIKDIRVYSIVTFMHSLGYSTDIVWVERSPRPRTSEVTYVPRSEVREYDWFVILRICDERNNKCVYVPLLLEELSRLYEFGGKVAMDKLLGVGIPIIFIKGKEIYLGPALAQGAFPAVIDVREFLSDLCEANDTIGMLPIFAELLEPEFWDEITSARLLYAPSLYVNFILKPLLEISRQDYRFNSTNINNNIVSLYWKVIELKTKNEISAFSGIITEKESIDYYSLFKEVVREYINKKCVSSTNGITDMLKPILDRYFKISDSDIVIIHVPLFTLRTVIPEEELLNINFRTDIHPVFESLISVALLLGHIIGRSKKVSIIIHTDECEIMDDNKIWFVEEWIMKKVRTILDSYNFESSNIEIIVYLWSRMFRYLRKQDVEKYIEILYKEILNSSFRNVCNIIVVRDTAKGFLYNLAEILKSKGNVFLIYVPEELRIFIENLPDDLRVKIEMPTRGILLSKDSVNMLPNENKDERKLYENCQKIGYLNSFICLIYLSNILESSVNI